MLFKTSFLLLLFCTVPILGYPRWLQWMPKGVIRMGKKIFTNDENVHIIEEFNKNTDSSQLSGFEPDVTALDYTSTEESATLDESTTRNELYQSFDDSVYGNDTSTRYDATTEAITTTEKLNLKTQEQVQIKSPTGQLREGITQKKTNFETPLVEQSITRSEASLVQKKESTKSYIQEKEVYRRKEYPVNRGPPLVLEIGAASVPTTYTSTASTTVSTMATTSTESSGSVIKETEDPNADIGFDYPTTHEPSVRIPTRVRNGN